VNLFFVRLKRSPHAPTLARVYRSVQVYFHRPFANSSFHVHYVIPARAETPGPGPTLARVRRDTETLRTSPGQLLGDVPHSYSLSSRRSFYLSSLFYLSYVS